jgi:predicted nucleotide-binding protein
LCVIFSETPPEVEVPKKPEATTNLTPEAVAAEKPIPAILEPAQVPPKANQIFVIHGRNKVPLDQLKKILTEPFNIPFKVAIDEPQVGRPISQKVAETMQNCTSAIVIFTADEEYTDAKGNKVFRPSDNAVYELGAASILYGKKIVILKEEGVTLPSDFSDLGHITFEKDRLDAKTSDLMKEFLGFGLLKVIPA